MKKDKTYPTPTVVDVDDATLAFPADVSDMLPPWEAIPNRFKCRGTDEKADKWLNLFSDLFFRGVDSIALAPKEGIDAVKASRMIKACMGSYQPKHEHKEAGCAYLLDTFFEDGIWEPTKPKKIF